MARITLEKLRREFGKTVAVDDLDITIDDKSFASFLGPSGCGKTTTLKMIAGLLPPTSGRIYFDDEDVTDLTPKDRKVGLVFQDYAIFPQMNAYKNIAYGLKIRGLPKNEIKDRVKEIAELLKISSILDKKPGRMTQSELQSVALGRTLITKPSLLLLDEPLSNLDAAFRVVMRAELKKFQMEIKQTVIYVTHDQVEAMALSDKVAVMNLGILQQYASPYEIYNHPNTRFTAGFIGSPPMNFFDCTFEDSDRGASLNQGNFKLNISKFRNIIKEETSSPELILGIRPEDINIYDKPASKNSIVMTVEAFEPLGSESIVDGRVEESSIRITTPPTYHTGIGEKKYIEFDMNRVHIFDKKTEKAIV